MRRTREEFRIRLVTRRSALVTGRVFFAAATQPAPEVTVIDLSAYPPWLVALVVTLVLTIGLWVMMKLLKWTLWILVFVVFIGGLCWSAYLLAEALGWL